MDCLGLCELDDSQFVLIIVRTFENVLLCLLVISFMNAIKQHKIGSWIGWAEKSLIIIPATLVFYIFIMYYSMDKHYSLLCLIINDAVVAY